MMKLRPGEVKNVPKIYKYFMIEIGFKHKIPVPEHHPTMSFFPAQAFQKKEKV